QYASAYLCQLTRNGHYGCGLVHFFFQAEDRIRDRNVTGVQTCALPIFKDCNYSACVFPVAAWSAKYCIELRDELTNTRNLAPGSALGWSGSIYAERIC